jgi:hypothetical protein
MERIARSYEDAKCDGNRELQTNLEIQKLFKFYRARKTVTIRISGDERFWRHLNLGWKVATSSSGMISAVTDIADVVDARIYSIASEALKGLKTLNAFGVLIGNMDMAIGSGMRAWGADRLINGGDTIPVFSDGWYFREAPIAYENLRRSGNPVTIARMIRELSLIDLMKHVSYIALAVISLLSHFLTIPSASYLF